MGPVSCFCSTGAFLAFDASPLGHFSCWRLHRPLGLREITPTHTSRHPGPNPGETAPDPRSWQRSRDQSHGVDLLRDFDWSARVELRVTSRPGHFWGAVTAVGRALNVCATRVAADHPAIDRALDILCSRVSLASALSDSTRRASVPAEPRFRRAPRETLVSGTGKERKSDTARSVNPQNGIDLCEK